LYKSTIFLRTEFSTQMKLATARFPRTHSSWLQKVGGSLVGKHCVRRLRAADHSCVYFQRFCYVIVEVEFPRKRTCCELRSTAPVGTPHLISDTVYTVNTDLFLQWPQLLDVTAAETDAVPLVSHSVSSHCSLADILLCWVLTIGLQSAYSQSQKLNANFLQIIRINR
jgi:hypothetical protein